MCTDNPELTTGQFLFTNFLHLHLVLLHLHHLALGKVPVWLVAVSAYVVSCFVITQAIVLNICSLTVKGFCRLKYSCGIYFLAEIIFPTPIFFLHEHRLTLNKIIIRCIFSFLFINRELITWPANNCLQISVLLQITFCSCIIETTLLCENGKSVSRALREWFDIFSWSNEQWSIGQLLNSVIAKYHDLSVSRRLFGNYLSKRWLRQIIAE